jgi:hypothetical protein
VRTRLAVAAAAALLLAAAVVVLAITRAGAPADRAATLVGVDAIAYVHASTDAGRDEDARLLRLLERFTVVREARARLERSIGAFDLRRDVRPWLGDEAALAVDARGAAVALLAVDDEPRAQGMLRRLGPERPALRHRGVIVRRFEAASAAFTGGFLVLGDELLVRRAIDLQRGRGAPLAERREYARAADERPDDRVVDVWLQPAALRLLAAGLPQLPGPLSASLAPADPGLRLDARALGLRLPQFAPELLGAVPEEAVAYLGLRTLEPLAALVPRGTPAAAELAGALLPVVRELDREVALSVSPADPEPVITLAARTAAPRRAREALGSLQGVIAELLVGSEDLTGQVPTFEERDLGGGMSAFALRLAGGGELVIAAEGNRVAVSNAEAGVRRALGEGAGLQEAEGFGATISGVPDQAEALGFVDLSQLLALGERAGLIAGTAIRRVRDDLRRLRAFGAVVQRQGTDTTAELTLQIP